MFKRYFLIFFIVLFSGCKNNNNNVSTIIEENSNFISSINYPITVSNKLNKIIKRDVKKQYNNFKKGCCDGDLREQFYVDFKYNFVNNRYINVVLEYSVNDDSFFNTYIFDIKFNKLLNGYDVFTKNDLSILVNRLDSFVISSSSIDIRKLNFIFDDTYLYFYFDNGKMCKLSLDYFDLDINISKDVINNPLYTYREVNKIIDSNSKVIAITFDDGPSKYTKLIVDLLNEYDANATFFILGNKVSIYGDTLKYLLDSGNEIGNHSFNHKWLTHVSSDELINQVNSTQDIIYNTLNYKPVLFRPTYGSVNSTIKNNINLEIVLWDVDTLDWKYKNSKKIADKALSKIKDGSIILMHDTYLYSYEALKIMLPKLKAEGYQFVTVSELNKIKVLRNSEH